MKAKFAFAVLVSGGLSVLSFQCLCQNKPGTLLKVYKTIEPVRIDGDLNDAAWLKADTAKNFFQNYPNDTLPASEVSEAFMTFDSRFLYFAFKCYTRKPTTQNMRRDFPQALTLHDVIYLNLGGFGDKANAYWFGISYPGVQYDGAISNGGDNETSYTDYWDAKWFAKTKKYDGYWVAEAAIPFKSFRYSNKVNWDINFLRGDPNNNQRSHWVRVPVQNMVGSQAFQGKMVTNEPLPSPGKNFVLIPYSNYSLQEDIQNKIPVSGDFKFGFDAKIGITPSLNLDLTFNPDFSHVEVDQQVVNLTRFEYNFPERRQFFLENSDLFGQLGFANARPFFTRRIGLVQDSTGTLRKVPILYGVRLSGKPSKALRIGVLNLQTQDEKSLGLPDQNYSMAAIQWRVLSRSFFSGFLVNKQSLGLGSYDSAHNYHSDLLHRSFANGKKLVELNKYNRVAGIEFNLLTDNNKWSGKTFYHQSFDAFNSKHNFSYGWQGDYNTRRLGFRWTYQNVGENFTAESGFIPGLAVYNGFLANTVRARTTLYPANSKVLKIEPSLESNFNQLPGRSITDQNIVVGNKIFFANQALINSELRHWYQKLPSNFNPIAPFGDSILIQGQSFSWKEYEIQFQADPRKRLSYTFGTGGGQFYNGSRNSIFGELVYRHPPYLTLSSAFNFTTIRLPEVYGKADFALISPKLDITFSPTLFFTTFIQYNTRSDNANINARFQWRFKPVSDFFIVYTENYLPENLTSKNRALVIKITYWLNL